MCQLSHCHNVVLGRAGRVGVLGRHHNFFPTSETMSLPSKFYSEDDFLSFDSDAVQNSKEMYSCLPEEQ